MVDDNTTKPNVKGLNPPAASLQAPVEQIEDPKALPFDPDNLRAKYLAERDKRLAAGRGLEQYRLIERGLHDYLVDPWVKPGFTRSAIEEHVDAVVLGGGYGALLVAVRLLERGITNIRIIEKAAGFGGTWYWNRYPGAQCDIESFVYMPLLEELGYIPTEKYAHSDELLRHAENIGHHYGLYPRTLFQTEVLDMTWDDHDHVWLTRTNHGDTIRSQFVIPAAGPLHRPKLPGLPVERFRGHSFHTSRWDYAYTGGSNQGNLTGLRDKRVAVIGTGATAVQIVPHLADSAKQLYVFQRTPSAIDYRNNRPTDPKWAASLKKGWQKERMDNFDRITNGIMEKEDLVNDGWTEILHIMMTRSSHTSDPAKAAAEKQLADFAKQEKVRNRTSEVVRNPQTAESLKAYYNTLCKRPCFHDEYLQAFNRPNVKLIDTRGAGVQDITEKGVKANGQEYEVDCIIYSTGFELATSYSHRSGMQMYGRNGKTIDEKWAEGVKTLHGYTMRDFPNCFLLSIAQAALSPNFLHGTGETAEHVAYVISEAKARGAQTVEPTEESEEEWTRTIVSLAQPRLRYLRECTPGYYNNEGAPADLRTARSSSYGGGSTKFFRLLRRWREMGDLEGLELGYALERAKI